METSSAASTAPNTAVAQVHWQSLLVVIVGCVVATIATAADSSAGGRQSAGSLHRTAWLLKGHRDRWLRCWVMDVVEEVVSVAVTVAMLSTAALLSRRHLQAARMGVAQGYVSRGGTTTWRMLLTAGWEPGHCCASSFTSCTRQTWCAFIRCGCTSRTARPLCVHTIRY